MDFNVPLHLVTSADEAAEFMRWLGQSRPLLCVDTETTGLSLYGRDRLRMVQFGDINTGWAIESHKWWGLIEEALKRYTGKWGLWNRNFDLHALHTDGLPMPRFRDTHDGMFMDRLLDPPLRHGLKPAGDRMMWGSGVGATVLADAKRKGRWDWATIPSDHPAYWAYAAWDPVLTARMIYEHWPKINARKETRDAYDVEMAVSDIMWRIENKGLPVDVPYTSQLLTQWIEEMGILEAELNALGLQNPNSGRQIAQAMELTEKWEPDEWTETGFPKVDSAVLRGIDSEISRRVLRFRRLRKWSSAYLERFLHDRDANDQVHPSINSMEARTGRMSITGIPLQTLPRGWEIRDCIRLPDGRALWACDYDSMEYRYFAHLTQSPQLREWFLNGYDPHLFAARAVHGDQTIEKKDGRRQSAKNNVYGMLFGAGAAKTAETAGITVAEAEAFRAGYFNLIPEVPRFLHDMDQLARQRTAESGRPYIFTVAGRVLPAEPKKGYKLVNYAIQGSCADIFKRKTLELAAAGFEDNLLLPVHDEWLFDFPEGETDGPEECARIMHEDRFSIPLTVELTGPFQSWGEKAKAKG